MKTVFVAILLLVASCAPRAVLVEPVAPAVTKARASVEAANMSSARLEKNVGSIHTGISSLGLEINKATTEADRLRKQGSATPAELEKQWKALTGIRTRNLFLETQSTEAVQNAAEQRFLRETANARLAELEKTAVTNDKGVEKLKTQIVRQEGDAALGRWMKRGIVIGAVVIFIAIALYIATRFRIL
ncbi:hypothetical protein JIN84_17835 [Luteolibacter yonseiensis]|uniref:Uncharacterized protein n=1 Tax=Luteolibacter yonseiensis TaxID=1144680 RepID=A0A934R785_9BACT|nr:hypothetical protein [Luteolibacter yonseiensis]MBK1817486.1 hypothetical protein [Luteolibacter yonseiensis]